MNMSLCRLPYEGVLNMLSSYCDYQVAVGYRNGLNHIAESNRKRADDIYFLLQERGYYNRDKK